MVALEMVLLVSILLQVVAVVLALRLIPVTGNLRAWIWISAAIALMAVRRGITLLHTPVTGLPAGAGGDLGAEVVAMITSLFLVVGIAYIAPLFRSFRESRDALAEETERLAVTLRSIGDGVITADTRGRVVLVNPVAEELTGWRQDEAAGRPFGEVFRAVDSESLQPREDPVLRVLDTGRAMPLEENTALVHRDGTRRIVADSGAPIRTRQGAVVGVVLVFRDVTEKRRMERDLLQVQKLESVGVLAGGIAHDFNNVLTAIMGNMGLAKMYTVPGGKAFAKIEDAERAARCAEDLARQLLTFSKGGMPLKQAVRLGGLLKSACRIGLSGSNVRCDLDVPEDTWPVEVDGGQIQQVFSNLVINAADSMPQGGTVIIRTENVTEQGEAGGLLKPGRYVRVSVRDEGSGIPAELLSMVFDPFFTTKKRGSGLGLTVVYSILQKHGGRVDVSSTPGEGSTFTLHLPAADQDLAEAEGPVAPAPSALRPGAGRLLVMDDEELVRQAAGDMLAHLGYEVVCARDGQEAVSLYREAREAGKPFDLVIMDLTVPGGMGGAEAFRRLRDMDPCVTAVVSSGYSDDPVMAQYQSWGFAGVIPKPYRLSDLADTVHAVLKRPHA